MKVTMRYLFGFALFLLTLVMVCCGKSLEHGSSPDKNGTNSSDGGHHHHSIHLASFQFQYVEQPLIITVFIFAAGIAKLAFHHAEFISSRVPESCLLIILGTIVGAIMSQAASDGSCITPANETSTEAGLRLEMSSTLFFLCLLPPIILESAYSLHERTFFENVGSVVIFAVIGTVLNCFLIGPTLFGLRSAGAMGSVHLSLKECLVFSAIIVAVDPVAVLAIFQEVGVNNVLYFLVFGESLFNDAVTVVLYNMMKVFSKMEEVPPVEVIKGLVSFFTVSLGGLSIGIIFGILTAIITKYTDTVRVVEPLAVFALAYISYLMAELFHFSGIISIIGCGLTQAHYAFHNISQKSHTTIKYFSKMQSALSDCIIFLFLGIGLFKCEILNADNWKPFLIIWTLVLCLLYRFLVVFGLTWIVNRSNRMRKINKEEQFIMAYGGLRGAVAFSLVDLLKDDKYLQHVKPIFMTTCLALIFFTVFVQGISIKPLVKIMRVRLQEKKELKMVEEINSHVTDHVMAGIEEVLGEHGENYFREILEYYNRKYIKNWLMKSPISIDEQIMGYYEELALQQHFENLEGSALVKKYCINLPWLDGDGIERAVSEEEVHSDDDGSDFTVLPAITVSNQTVPPDVSQHHIRDLEERLIKERSEQSRRKRHGLKRKSIFPGFMRNKEQHQVSADPSARELKSIFAPSRREMQHTKLDKNLKDESSTDLLKYLQDKQFRTRRMSRAISGNIKSNSPSTSSRTIHSRGMVDNYRRRLSLAVPEHPRFQRGRSPSDVTNLRSANLRNECESPSISPARKRKLFKRSRTVGEEDCRTSGSPSLGRSNLLFCDIIEEEPHSELPKSNSEKRKSVDNKKRLLQKSSAIDESDVESPKEKSDSREGPEEKSVHDFTLSTEDEDSDVHLRKQSYKQAMRSPSQEEGSYEMEELQNKKQSYKQAMRSPSQEEGSYEMEELQNKNSQISRL